MIGISDERIKVVGQVLADQNRPLKERFRALFTLKNVGGSVAIECIEKCFSDPSALLKHELAYNLGQMRDPKSIPLLVSILKDKTQEGIVRHESAEALGAIGSPDLKAVLEEFKKDDVVEVSETCELALNRIEWLLDLESSKENLLDNPFNSVDPAPPAVEMDVNKLKDTLLNENESLFNRYRAMFTLRNIGNKESVLALSQALKAGSTLFRHEVAFVLGQLQDPESVSFLRASLEDCTENEMVRHECAESLGAVATPECLEVLQRFLADEKRVVRESCEVALDMCEYENSPEFQYADTLLHV